MLIDGGRQIKISRVQSRGEVLKRLGNLDELIPALWMPHLLCCVASLCSLLPTVAGFLLYHFVH